MRHTGLADAGLAYYCDAAIGRGGEACGIAVVVRDAAGGIVAARQRRLGPMTNNEAEYEALILALEFALERGERHARLAFLVDSQIVVGQVAGMFSVRSPHLAPRHRRVRELLARLPGATLVFVPRDRNRVADALAVEALAEGGGERD